MQYEKFMKSLNEGIDKFIPKTKQNRTCNNHKKWFNLRCVRARADKELLWKRYKRHPSAAALERYIQRGKKRLHTGNKRNHKEV